MDPFHKYILHAFIGKEYEEIVDNIELKRCNCALYLHLMLEQYVVHALGIEVKSFNCISYYLFHLQMFILH